MLAIVRPGGRCCGERSTTTMAAISGEPRDGGRAPLSRGTLPDLAAQQPCFWRHTPVDGKIRQVMRLLALSIGLLFTGCSSMTGPNRGRFEGEIGAGREICRIGIELRGERALIDLPSRWTLGVEVDLGWRGGAAHLDVPELGRLELHPAGKGLIGTLVAQNGGTAAVRLEPAQSPAPRLHEVRFSSGDLELAATLGVPAWPGRHPAVVLVPGGGDSMRSQPATRFLAEYLPRLGFACLVYDKRGCGASTGNWREVGLEELARDALAAVAALRARDDIDPAAIGFFAASQGTWVALEACVHAGNTVAFVVHHSGPAMPVLHADTYALASAAQAAGLDANEHAEVAELWRLECAAVRDGVAPAESAPLLAALSVARQRPWFRRLPYEATGGDHWWVGWYRRVMDFDPRPRLEVVTVPMLWLFGGADSQSDVVASLEVISRLSRDRGRPWSVHVFPRANHGIMVPLFDGATGEQPTTMANGYFDILFGWLRQNCGCTVPAGPPQSR